MERLDIGNMPDDAGQKQARNTLTSRKEDLYHWVDDEENLLKKLQEKLGKTKQKIRNWLHIMG